MKREHRACYRDDPLERRHEPGGAAARLIRADDLAEAMEFSKLIANSSFVPQEYRGKPGDILVCLQMGAELGLSPLSALQSISRDQRASLSVWGDGAIALVQASGLLEDHEEDVVGEGDERYGYCRMIRRGRPRRTSRSSRIADAKRAGLWGRNVWKRPTPT